MEITHTKRGPFCVMAAPEGHYITQCADTPERQYLRERMLLASESAADWRTATQQEKNEYDALNRAEDPESEVRIREEYPDKADQGEP